MQASISRSLFHGKDRPFAGDPLKNVSSTLTKPEPGTSNQVLDGARGAHFVGACVRQDSRGCVNGNAANISADELYLAGVQSTPDLQAKSLDFAARRKRAIYGTRRTIESGQVAVTRAFDGASLEPLDLRLHHRIVVAEEIAPEAIAHLDRACG